MEYIVFIKDVMAAHYIFAKTQKIIFGPDYIVLLATDEYGRIAYKKLNIVYFERQRRGHRILFAMPPPKHWRWEDTNEFILQPRDKKGKFMKQEVWT